MTLKERLLAVFRGERPDVMPWFADITYWYGTAEEQGTLPEKYRGEGIYQLYRDLGCGAHEHVLGRPYEAELTEVESNITYEYDADGEPYREQTYWRTPVGSLTRIKQYEPASNSWAYRKYAVQTPDDLKVLRFICEHQHLVSTDFAGQTNQIKAWGGVGVASTFPPRNPLSALLVSWMGVMNVSYALHDMPAEVEKTMDVMAQADDPVYEAIADSPAPLVYFGENLTGEVISPTWFKKYCAPYYIRRANLLRKKGKYIFLHIDGTMRSLLPLIADTGIHCAQSLTPAPVGDVALSEMRELAGDELILWSGVPGVCFSPLYPFEVVRNIVMDCFKYHKEFGRFIIGVCDQVPPDGEIERVRMISDLVEEYGRYE